MTNNINTLILSALKDKSLYGLEIIKNIQEETKGKLILKQPSLYSSLRRLETQGFVSSYWSDSELGGKRHYYNITPMGLEHLKKKLSLNEAEETFFNDTAQQILKDKSIVMEEKNLFTEVNKNDIEELNTEHDTNKQNIKEQDKNNNLPEQNIQELNIKNENKELKIQELNEKQTEQSEQSEQNIKQYSPIKNKGSFTDTMRTYVAPKNMYPEYGLGNTNSKNKDLEEKNTSPSTQKEVAIIFPEIDGDLEFDDLLDGELLEDSTSLEHQSDEINYKDILGDLLDEEEVKPQTIIPPTPTHSTKIEQKINVENKEDLKALDKSREYAKHYANILTSKDTEEENINPFEPKENTPVNPFSIKLLEEISKRHQQKIDQPQESTNYEYGEVESLEEIESSLNEEKTESEISSGLKIARHQPASSVENTKYILINKLKIFSQLFLSIIMLVEIAVLFTLYFVKNWIDFEQYIIFGISLFVVFILLIMRLIEYKRYPDKKIRKKVKWGKNLSYRILATVLLIVFAISINLLLGMNDFFQYDYLLRWLLPSILLTNIFVVWIINISLAHKVKYQQ